LNNGLMLFPDANKNFLHQILGGIMVSYQCVGIPGKRIIVLPEQQPELRIQIISIHMKRF